MKTKILSKIAKEPEVRTTITLSLEGSNALDCLMNNFGFKQKQVFDAFITKEGVNADIISIASQSNSNKIKRQVRKSLVVTKRNLKLLNESAEKAGLQRDIIIDFAFRFLVVLLQNEKKQQDEQHQKSLVTLNKLSNLQLKTEQELQSILDEDDAVLARMSLVITVLNNLIREVENCIKNGTPVDPDGM